MSAIRAEFAHYNRLKTRKTVQLIMEVPEEALEKVFATLGYPLSGQSIWVGIARLQEQETETTQEIQNG